MKDLPDYLHLIFVEEEVDRREPYVQGGKGLRENLRVCQTG